MHETEAKQKTHAEDLMQVTNMQGQCLAGVHMPYFEDGTVGNAMMVPRKLEILALLILEKTTIGVYLVLCSTA